MREIDDLKKQIAELKADLSKYRFQLEIAMHVLPDDADGFEFATTLIDQNAQLRTELDEARKVIEAANMGDWFTPTSDWLDSHPKDGVK
jgi:hypothetical protein